MSTSPVVGTFSDSQIIEAAARGELFTDGFDRGQIKQACYELRTSAVYYDLAAPERPIQLSSGETILLKPRQLVVVITEEELKLPSDVLGRVLSKGQLFSLGIVPVNTYADPGFSGRLGIVLNNSSNDYLALPQGESIAKIEFVRLSSRVENPYHGQHGYETVIWPIKHQYRLTAAQVKDDPRVGSSIDELGLSHGPYLEAVTKRVFKYERRLIFAAVVYMLFMTGALALGFIREDRLNIWLSVGTGVASNIIFLLLTWAATSIVFDRRRK